MPSRPSQQSEVFTYPGTDYEGVRLRGLRTEPFERESIVDVPTAAAGRLLLLNYVSLIGQNNVQLVYHNWNFDNENIRVTVLDCQLSSLQRRLVIANALNQGNIVDLIVRWRLIFSPITS
jgi:hypothetical protein